MNKFVQVQNELTQNRERDREREGRYLAGGGDDTRTVGGSNTVTSDGFMTSQSSRLCHFAVALASWFPVLVLMLKRSLFVGLGVGSIQKPN